jgi:N-acyl-L-homoserine lactone synthetase
VSDAPEGPVSLDALARRILTRSGYRFTLANDDTRDTAYRLRHEAVVEQGWYHDARDGGLDDQEHDHYDANAIHVLGWDGEQAIATGRLVPPPGPLPTEDACGLIVEPRGEVVDVGRMTVARSYQGPDHPVFLALLARLYLEVRARGFDVACGMMSPRARALVRMLGLQIEMLGDDRVYWGEPRAPVRFNVMINSTALAARWR